MKKLGTPTGSDPGSANENGELPVGIVLEPVDVRLELLLVALVVDDVVVDELVVVLVCVGLRFCFGLGFAACGPLLPERPEGEDGCPEAPGLDECFLAEGGRALPDPAEPGRCCEDVVDVELDLVLEVEVVVVVDSEDDDELVLEADVDGERLPAAVLVVLEVVDGAAQDSLSLTICAPAGSRPAGTGICDAGVPGATLAVKSKRWPPCTVIVTVHSSATASGADASATAASSVPAVATVTFSLLLLTTVA